MPSNEPKIQFKGAQPIFRSLLLVVGLWLFGTRLWGADPASARPEGKPSQTLAQHPMARPFSLAQDPAPPDLPSGLVKGHGLAQQYCRVCHLFPDPNLLDKQTWMNGALRRMAPLLGVGRRNLEKQPDRAILEEAGLFPSDPLISETDWREIVHYYLQAAPSRTIPQSPRAPIERHLSSFKVKPFPVMFTNALISLVKIDAANRRLYVGNAQDRSLSVFDLSQGLSLSKRLVLDSPPVSMTPRRDGLYVVLIGQMFPSDLKDGKLIRLQESTNGFVTQVLLDQLQRPVEATFADLNGDGREDFTLSAFGNYLGRFSWYENLGAQRYEQHVLLANPGSIGSVIHDFNHDGLPDVLVLMAQARESLHLMLNQGKGDFEDSTLAEFPPAYGMTHLELADVDGDRATEVVLTNGDNGEYPSPFKHYHGIRILQGDAGRGFKEVFFYPMNGAFKTRVADFDGDGDLDVAAISFFPNYEASPEESFVYLENQGGIQFKASSFPLATQGRWLTMDSGDLDGDGDLDLVLGSFPQGPPSIPIPRNLKELWRTNGVGILILENQLHPR